MKKNIAIIIALIAIGAIIFTVFSQQGKITELQDALVDKENDIANLHDNLQEKDEVVDSLATNNNVLVLKVSDLRDSIALLNTRIKYLENAIKSKDKELAKIRAEIARAEKDSDVLRAEIIKLKKDGANDPRIAQLEAENSALTQMIYELQNKEDNTVGDIEILQDEEIEIDLNKKLIEDAKNIVANTSVTYLDVELSTTRFSTAYTNRVQSDWKFTKFTLILEHQEEQLIDGQDFTVELYNTDNGETLPFNEGGKIENGNGNKGHMFVHKRTPHNIKYINTERKSGTNYGIRVLYISPSGDVYELSKSHKQIVRDMKVVK